jgi:RNA 3'-terminal phosphate cyclase (ATP)
MTGTTVMLDGSRGEGGGQILRTALALSAITGRPLELDRIRARRAKPGLQRQHLTCVLAAAELCGAEVTGAAVGSSRLTFTPGARRGGSFTFDIGTAGSTGLVLQTVLPILLGAPAAAVVEVRGGTHNPQAPCFDFLDRVFVPALRRMGARVELAIDAHGFYPAGGGRVVAQLEPAPLAPAAFVERGPITRRWATAIVARLPTHVATRELMTVQERLDLEPGECEVRDVRSAGPGNALLIELEFAGGRELVTGFGEKGVRAELVAETACEEARTWLAAGVPVGDHLADQLLLPMALAGGGRFRTRALTLHATTNIDTIRAFVDVSIETRASEGGAVEVVIGTGASA